MTGLKSSMTAALLMSALGAAAGIDTRPSADTPHRMPAARNYSPPSRTRNLTPAAASDERAKRKKNKTAAKSRAKNKKGR